MKYYLIAAFIVIVACLASAGIFLVKDTSKDQDKPIAHKKRMAWALTWRIGLSVCLFISLWVFYLLGWIKPTGLPMHALQ
jgi:Protein of unknown function (DUF2909)